MKNIWMLLLCAIVAFGQTSVTPLSPGQIPTLTVSWTEGTPNVSSFNVYRGTTPGGEDYTKPWASVNGTVFSYIDAAVLPGSTYFYTVKAVLGVESAPSSEVSMQVPVPPSPPSPPVTKITTP